MVDRLEEYRNKVRAKVACPYCKARAGQPCVISFDAAGSFPLHYVHDDRSAAYDTAINKSLAATRS